jgi:acyl-CoA thioester hydrolase
MVRFYELDALNHVNNAAYLRWFETVRVRYLIDYGISDYSHGPDTPEIVVRAVTAEYLRPMFQNESYVVTARTREIRNTSFLMDYAVYCGEVRATGSCVVVMLDREGSTKMRIPTRVRKTLVARDEAVQLG